MRTGLMALRTIVGLACGLSHVSPAAAQPRVDHKVTVIDPSPVTVGQRGAVSLTIAAEPGYTISSDGPLRVEVRLPAGASTSKPRYSRADAADARADNPRFDLRYEIEAVGEHTMTIRLTFWVCATRSCRPVSVDRTALLRGIEPAATP